jgi:hypothetical protein
LEPGVDGGVVSALEQPGGPVFGDQLDRRVVVAGGDRVPDGVVGVSLGQEPPGRPSVQRRDRLGPGAFELQPQQLAEEVVVAVPLASIVQRHEEEVRALYLLKHPARRPLPGHGVAQRRGQPVEDRRAEEKVAHLLSEPAQDLAPEVVDHVAVVAGELVDETRGIGLLADGECGEIESRDPPLRTAMKRLDVRFGQGQVEQPVQELSGLFRREAQLASVDLEQIPPGSQAGERQPRLRPSGHCHLAGVRQVLDKESHLLRESLRVGEVIVVQRDYDPLRYCGQLVDEHRQSLLLHAHPRGRQQLQ